jgi:3-deoxy-D-manno-octulosonate 8-phosphate phosphatase (KDO 8-P phosphatase)
VIDSALAKRIRIVGLDVDGVLTDGGLYLGDAAGTPVELKRYHIEDGLGVRFLRSAGLKVVIVTGRVSESVRQRAAELSIDDVSQDSQGRKLPAFRKMLDKFGFEASEAAFVGDDLPDLSILRLVALPVAVGNAVPEVRAACKVTLARRGGDGAVREFTEMLLRARGEWDELVEEYITMRSLGGLEVLR